MELEVSGRIGAERYERNDGRTAHRNGYRQRRWDTRVGSIPLQIPKVMRGSYSPSFLEPSAASVRTGAGVSDPGGVRARREHAKVEDLVQALGLTGVSKSEVSRLCADLGVVVGAFRNRPLDGRYPYL